MNFLSDRLDRRFFDVSSPIRLGNAGWIRCRMVFGLMALLVAARLSGTASAAIDIQAKAVKVESKEDEEIWGTSIGPTKAFSPGTKPDLLPTRSHHLSAP